MAAKDRNQGQENSILSAAQERAVLMIASGKRGREVAETLGVSEFVVSRWRQTPDFRAAVNAIQLDARQSAIAKLRNLSEKAVLAIEDILLNTDAPAADRLRAATLVLDRLSLDSVGAIGPDSADDIQADDARQERRKNILSQGDSK